MTCQTKGRKPKSDQTQMTNSTVLQLACGELGQIQAEVAIVTTNACLQVRESLTNVTLVQEMRDEKEIESTLIAWLSFSGHVMG